MREADQLNKETVMKMIALAAAALIGASFASTSASALPANPSVNSFAPEAQVIQVAEWKGKRSGKRKFWKHRGNKKFFKHRRGHRDRDRNFSFGFGIPLRVTQSLIASSFTVSLEPSTPVTNTLAPFGSSGPINSQ
jgi:hypothetical protein